MPNIMLSYWYRLYQNQTKQEDKLEREICKLGVRYRTQHPFLGIKAFADFYLPDYKLVIEVDDISHEKKIKKDRLRTERLAGLGIETIRFTNKQVDSQIQKVLDEIRGAIGRKGISSI